MINNDKELLNNIISGTRLKRNIIDIYYNNKDIFDYIHNRYNDTVSVDDTDLFYEVYYRIKNNIEYTPVCAFCNNKVYFIHNDNYYCYAKTCKNKKCQKSIKKQNRDITIKQKYGVDNPYQIESVKQKIHDKIYSKYGGFTLDKHSIIYNKYKSTMLNRYGVINPMLNKRLVDKLHNVYLQKYGVINPWSNPDIIQKCQNTQKQNKTFRKSREEDKCYKLLCDKFSINNIVRQYKSELYPFRCDFYIKSIDTYIEYNGFFTHNDHLYNKNNIKDIITKCKWLNKAKLKPIYYNAVNTWTKKDVIKYKTAKMNNLNYLVFYDIE